MAPSRAEQDELHRAIVGQTDPTATARAFDLLLEPLKVRLRFRWPNMSQDELESWAIDSLIAYLENPARYDPKQSALQTYLVMDADGDIKNAYSSAQATRERFVGDVEDEASRRNETTDDEKFNLDDRALYARLREAFPDERDRKVIELMLQNVRETAAYADVLAVAHLSSAQQAAEVKRVKDRIKKRLRGLFEEIG
jgi:RNA polymerase sigma-70 factor (ECF subfamily)